MMHRASEMLVLVIRGRMVSLILVRERSIRLLFHEDFRDRAVTIKAKASRTDDMLPLPSAWAHEMGLPIEEKVPDL